jgi:hypothetical protein
MRDAARRRITRRPCRRSPQTPGRPLRPEPGTSAPDSSEKSLEIERADARIRTADPFITSEVLYQLSYVGRGFEFSGCAARNLPLVCTIEGLE